MTSDFFTKARISIQGAPQIETQASLHTRPTATIAASIPGGWRQQRGTPLPQRGCYALDQMRPTTYPVTSLGHLGGLLQEEGVGREQHTLPGDEFRVIMRTLYRPVPRDGGGQGIQGRMTIDHESSVPWQS